MDAGLLREEEFKNNNAVNKWLDIQDQEPRLHEGFPTPFLGPVKRYPKKHTLQDNMDGEEEESNRNTQFN
jgi:hypothetical protein